MTITSSGLLCDICGHYILGLFDDDKYLNFTIKGMNNGNDMHGHVKCCAKLREVGNDWRKLPDGPIRKAFQKCQNEIDKLAEAEKEQLADH